MDNNIFSWQENDYMELLNAFNTKTKILLIHGNDFESPYHVLSTFYATLSNQGQALFSIYSDSTHLTYPLLPFTHAANETVKGGSQKKPLLLGIFKDITQSDTMATIVENIVNERHISITLSDRENELVSRLEYASEGHTPVFLFYRYPLFDANSQNLALLLLSGQLNYDFPFLKDARFIFLCEADDAQIVFQRIKRFEHIDIHLSTPQPNDMSEILTEIAPELNLLPVEQEKLFYLSGGRLSIMEILSRYLISKGQTEIATSAQEVVKSTLEERISQMGELGITMESILEFAANIGKTFQIPLLKRVSEESVCDAILRKSDQEFLTQCNQNTGKFVYHEIWDFFYSNSDEVKRREIALSLEKAVYYFDPYDYFTRAHYLEQAECVREACELYLLAYNSTFQEGLDFHDLGNKITEISTKCGLTDYWDSLIQVYTEMNSLNFENCLQILESMAHPATTRLLLLREYLTGLCMHRLGSTHSQQQSAAIVMQAASDHARDVEEGLWCDCNMALISFLVNDGGDINFAKRIYKELTYYYTQKNFAPFAQKGLYALERKWSALYSVERAVIKTENSVRFFRNGVYPSQYLMALNNHAANLIVLGKYTEAMKYLNEARCALHNYPAIRVNRMYLLNNYCLCAVLSERLSPLDAYKYLLPIIKHKTFGDWTIIFQLNCSIYMALAGELEDAERNLRDLEHISQELCDDYYLFYVYANLAAVLYLQGHCRAAIHLLIEKCSQAPRLFKTTEKAYVEERTKRWINAMESIEIKEPKEFDTYLLNTHPEQTQWAFIGRGFLYSDIQFWSEP